MWSAAAAVAPSEHWGRGPHSAPGLDDSPPLEPERRRELEPVTTSFACPLGLRAFRISSKIWTTPWERGETISDIVSDMEKFK